MKGSEYIFMNRDWIAKAMRYHKPSVVSGMVDAIFAYAYGYPMPEIPPEIHDYFFNEICPGIDMQRMEWRQFDRRASQFYEVIKELPDILRPRYEADFLTATYKDEVDFLAYLDELREDLSQLNARDNEQ